MAKKSTFRTNWPKFVLQLGVLAAIIFFVSGFAVKLFPGITALDPEKKKCNVCAIIVTILAVIGADTMMAMKNQGVAKKNVDLNIIIPKRIKYAS